MISENNDFVEAEILLPENETESTTDFISPTRDAAIRNYFSDGKKSEKGIAAIIDSMLRDPALIVRDHSIGHDIVSFSVNGTDSTILHNLVFSFAGDTLKEAVHYAFDLGDGSTGKLQRGELSLTNYTGEVHVNPAKSILSVLQKDGLGDCFTLSVVNNNRSFTFPIRDPNPGGWGPGAPSKPSGPIGGTTFEGGTTRQICLEIIPNPNPGSESNIGILVYCDTRLPVVQPGQAYTSDEDEESTYKNIQKSDCGSLLKILGIVAGPRGVYVNLAEHLRREKLLNGTSFQANGTISRILDFNTLSRCRSRNECVRNQLITYVNDQLDGYFAGALHGGVTNSILDQHLISITEAAYQADINNNVSLFESVSFVLRNMQNELVTNKLSEILLQAAILHVNNPDNFSGNAAAYITVLNKTNGELSSEHTTWLMMHPEVLVRLSEGDVSSQIASDLAEIYIELYQTNHEFRDLADGEFEAMPGYLWVLIREVGIEVAIEIIKRQIPGFNRYDDVIDAINNARQGDLIGFLAEVADIAKTIIGDIVGRSNPVFLTLKISIDGIEIGSKASRVWKAVVKLEKFGGDAIEKLFETVSSRGGGLLGKIAYQNNKIGIDLKDVGVPKDFRDELLMKLSESFSVSRPIIEGNNLRYDIGVPVQFSIIYQPTSSTTGNPSLVFRKGGYKVKLRF